MKKKLIKALLPFMLSVACSAALTSADVPEVTGATTVIKEINDGLQVEIAAELPEDGPYLVCARLPLMNGTILGNGSKNGKVLDGGSQSFKDLVYNYSSDVYPVYQLIAPEETGLDISWEALTPNDKGYLESEFVEASGKDYFALYSFVNEDEILAQTLAYADQGKVVVSYNNAPDSSIDNADIELHLDAVIPVPGEMEEAAIESVSVDELSDSDSMFSAFCDLSEPQTGILLFTITNPENGQECKIAKCCSNSTQILVDFIRNVAGFSADDKLEITKAELLSPDFVIKSDFGSLFADEIMEDDIIEEDFTEDENTDDGAAKDPSADWPTVDFNGQITPYDPEFEVEETIGTSWLWSVASLANLGYLPAEMMAWSGDVITDDIREALKAYQKDHELIDNGILNFGTMILLLNDLSAMLGQ